MQFVENYDFLTNKVKIEDVNLNHSIENRDNVRLESQSNFEKYQDVSIQNINQDISQNLPISSLSEMKNQEEIQTVKRPLKISLLKPIKSLPQNKPLVLPILSNFNSKKLLDAPKKKENQIKIRVPREKERIYKCSKCSKTFKRIHALECHLSTHNFDDNDQTGEESDKVFNYNQGEEVNIFEHFNQEQSNQPKLVKIDVNGNPKVGRIEFKYQPYLEEKETKSLNFNKHEFDYDNRPMIMIKFQCEVCLMVFKSADTLMAHRDKHNTVKDKNSTYFNCTFCDKSYLDRSLLVSHVAEHLNENKFYLSDSTNSNFNLSMIDSKNELDEQILTDIEEDDWELTEENDEFKVAKEFECNVCRRVFNNGASLKRHIRNHTLERPYKCDKCPLTYQNLESLNHHKKKHSLTEKPFKCSHCHFDSYDMGILTRHLRKHTGERPYICTTCGMGFKTMDTLNMHQRTHTGEKPYKCEICWKEFAYRSNWRVHKIRHTGVKPYKCDVCEYEFVDKPTFKVHLRRHTGEKPYSCPECSKTFAHSSGLNNHLRIHQAIRPFKCDQCEKDFVRVTHLRRHQKCTHKNN